ncbi:Gfo/Idh/MocA family protein [Roseimaritima ulvae]|uniref:1,5-anhydro-D-fructose reductase n=1 Tax=Roseimaritima ulvae TaxID=980254 RepID=A0A5B9QTD7_9BACT|nr:Gfo/Idh/MocA family oxidoreductase [Roseimaritima ulvae]QEG42284.1 1,5-anhydro-D-fructose reductase [Roseimaritima ulvae]
MRFGILGTGRITRRLVADLQSTPGVQVTAIASRDAERAAWYAQQYGVATGLCGYQALLDAADVDAVYIALPPSLHAQWAIAAAAAGKHLLCEKPLATNHADALAIAEACRAGGVRWLDATGWLHHRRTAAFSERAHDGELGKLRHISTAVSFFEPFQSGDHRLVASLGGGCLLDLGWYAVGLPIWFAGQPQAVMASGIYQQDVLYRVTAMLWFDHDVTATVSCGYDTTTRKWFEVAGDSGSIVCDDFTRSWAERKPRFWTHDRTGSAQAHEFEDHQEQHMIQSFVDKSIDLSPWQRQALLTQQTLDAMLRSIASGQRETLDVKELSS